MKTVENLSSYRQPKEKSSKKIIRKVITLIMIVFFTLNLRGQFTDSGISFPETGYCYSEWGDYDNDGDLDIMFFGSNAKLYVNNSGSFTNSGVTFSEKNTMGTWIDFDNDNDLDIFMGTILYRNDAGTFVQVQSADFNEYFLGARPFSSIDAIDYDNDGDDDLLIGYEGKILLFNNRNGVFLKVDQNITGGDEIGGSYINNLWIDSDNDGYFDIISSRLHKNNTHNIFIADPALSLNDIGYRVATGDYNNDGRTDALYTANSQSVMMENINGTFNNADLPCLNTTIYGYTGSFADFNNDGKLDFSVMHPGLYLNLFANNGSDAFTKTVVDISMLGGMYSIKWGDFDSDGDLDFVLSGNPNGMIYRNTLNITNQVPVTPGNLQSSVSGNSVTLSWDRSTDNETLSPGLTYNLYLKNISSGKIIKCPQAILSTGKLLKPCYGNTHNNNNWSIKGLREGTYEWTVQSVDHTFQGSPFASSVTFAVSTSSIIAPSNDQTLIPGQSGPTLTVSETGGVTSRQWAYSKYPGGPYINDISGATGTSFTPSFNESGRYFLICKSLAGSNTLFSNEVMVEVLPFTESILPGGFAGYWNGAMKAGDSDNDGDMDILVSGFFGTNVYIFESGEVTGLASVTSGLFNSDAAWFDFNKDNKLDFIVTGSLEEDATSLKKTIIYINQGANTFSELTHNIIGLAYGSVDVGDYDHDGDPDIVICGMDSEPMTKIYRNDNGQFVDLEIQISHISDGVAKWGDYDNDDDLDLFLTGTDFSGNPYTALWRNDGEDIFNKTDFIFDPCKYSFAEFGDYDNDDDLDILISGMGVDSKVRPTIYKNLGDNYFLKIILLTDMGYNHVKWFDYNNDGLLDVFLIGNEWYSYTLLTEYSSVHNILENKGNDLFENIQYNKS